MFEKVAEFFTVMLKQNSKRVWFYVVLDFEQPSNFVSSTLSMRLSQPRISRRVRNWSLRVKLTMKRQVLSLFTPFSVPWGITPGLSLGLDEHPLNLKIIFLCSK